MKTLVRVLLLLLLGGCSQVRPPERTAWGLEAVSFEGSGFRPVELDGYGTARGPHWPFRSAPPTVAEDVPEYYRLRGPPLAYLAGSMPEASVRARVPSHWRGPVQLEAEGSGWRLAGTGEAADGLLTARAEADRAVPQELTSLPDWRLRWRAVWGTETADLGSSSAQLYVLLAEPRGPLLHTALELAARHAAGATAPEQVLAGVWSAFARGVVRRARDGLPLRYYGEYLDGAPAELRRFLVGGTGQCVAWSHLLYAALAAHGLEPEVVALLPPEGGQLFIAPWRFIDGRHFIDTGANGVAETEAAGDDVAWIELGRGVPHSRIWAPDPLPIGRLHGDDTLAYLVGANGLAETFVDTALALPLLARGFGLEQQPAWLVKPGARITPGGDDVIVRRDSMRLVLTGANGVLETPHQPGLTALPGGWTPVPGQGSTARPVQAALPRSWPLLELGGDDRERGWRLTTGEDGVSQTRGARHGQGQPHAAAIDAGANGRLDTRPAGDDRVIDLAEYLRDAPPSHDYVSGINMWAEPGPGAQQNAYPPAQYPQHVLLRVGGAWFDPSYGRGPFASLLDWERELLAGVGVPIIRAGAIARLDGRTLYAVRRAPGTRPLTRARPLPPPS